MRLIHVTSVSQWLGEAHRPSGFCGPLWSLPVLSRIVLNQLVFKQELSGCHAFGRMAGSPCFGSFLRKHLKQNTAVGFVRAHTHTHTHTHTHPLLPAGTVELSLGGV